jgi:hypothetical protein
LTYSVATVVILLKGRTRYRIFHSYAK